MALIRKSREADWAAMLAIVNAAAQAYRGVIPADQWRDPYMPSDDLEKEIADGVVFWVAEEGGHLLAVMGIQDKGEIALVRHAYVTPGVQRKGVGTSLLQHVQRLTGKPVLVGTWADASWAIEFYQRNGFTLVPNTYKDFLLRRYWSIPARQVETSVVLADGPWMEVAMGKTQETKIPRWGVAALPLSVFVGVVLGAGVGVAVAHIGVGVAVGAALGLGVGVAATIAIFVFRSSEPPGSQ